MWILFIFWWGPNAGVIKTIDLKSYKACEQMAKSIFSEKHKIAGNMHTFCDYKNDKDQ